MSISFMGIVDVIFLLYKFKILFKFTFYHKYIRHLKKFPILLEF